MWRTARDYLSVLAADLQCVHAMAFFMRLIGCNRLPGVARTLLTTCTLCVAAGRLGTAEGQWQWVDTFYRMDLSLMRCAAGCCEGHCVPLMAPHPQWMLDSLTASTQIVQSEERPPDCRMSVCDSPGTASSQRPMACLSGGYR